MACHSGPVLLQRKSTSFQSIARTEVKINQQRELAGWTWLGSLLILRNAECNGSFFKARQLARLFKEPQRLFKSTIDGSDDIDRSMGTLLYQWASRGCDLERSMKIALNSDLILPQLLPQFFQKSERVEGDGGAGTIRLMTLGPAITGGVERTNKERVLEYDDESGIMAWELLDDHRYSKLVTTLKVVECSNGHDSILHWQLEYEPRDASVLPPEDIKMVHFEAMKAVQNHADLHPHWP